MIADISLSIWLIAILFFLVALAYSSVGLGGGSSYTALMVILGFNSLQIPLLSLLFNLSVTTIGSYYFIKQGHLRFNLLLPFILSSMPMAWIGGSLNVSAEIFQWVLLISLFTVVLRIYFWKNSAFSLSITKEKKWMVSILSGATLGLLAGIVGIGGGIYLVPLILLLGLGSIKEAAACGAVFIWLNSLVGLTARLQYNFIDLTQYYPLLIAILMGGLVGAKMGAVSLAPAKMEKILGSVVVIAFLFLANKLILQ